MPNHKSYRTQCTQVTPQCPVEFTTYGYYPSLPANTTLLAIFALCALLQIAFGIWKKNRAFSIVVALSCAMEAVGYGGRIMLHQNPYDQNGFKIQIVMLILAPSFMAAGVYLTVKHVVLYLGPEHSRLKPHLYTWIFCTCDIVSIVIQAVGGGLAAAADSGSKKLLDAGDGLIIAGIAFQVATQFVCACLALDFFLKWKKASKLNVAAPLNRVTKGLKFFVISSSIAFLTIFIRCVYRLPEMAGGWGGPLMRKENEFLILDGAMIAVAAMLFTAAHPGIFFPEISSRYVKRQNGESSVPSETEKEPDSS